MGRPAGAENEEHARLLATTQDAQGRVRRIVLNERSRLAQHCLTAFQQLVTSTGVVVVLGKP